jgi:hypothetical protein
MRNPVECFSKVASKTAARANYTSVGLYRKLWLPVLSMEAALGSVKEAHSAIIRNVPVSWHRVGNEPVRDAQFRISVSFCAERCIRFAATGESEDEDGSASSINDSSTCVGYMCIRYGDVAIPVPHMEVPFDRLIDMQGRLTWVGHCLVTRVTVSKDKLFYNVHLRLHKYNFPLPQSFLDSSASRATCEWISKSLPDR